MLTHAIVLMAKTWLIPHRGNKMKKKLLTAVSLLLIAKNKLHAQQWAMDEAYDDWRETSSDGFSVGGLIGLVVLIGIVWLISKGVKVAKEEHTRKMELRKKNEKKTDDIVSTIDKIIDSINQKQQ